MSALPIRMRLTLAFALVMAVVLAGMGFFVYVRVGNALIASVDQSLTRPGARGVEPCAGQAGRSSTRTPWAA